MPTLSRSKQQSSASASRAEAASSTEAMPNARNRRRIPKYCQRKSSRSLGSSFSLLSMDSSRGSNGSYRFGASSRSSMGDGFGEGSSIMNSMNCSMVWSNEASSNNTQNFEMSMNFASLWGQSYSSKSSAGPCWGEASVKFSAKNFVAQNAIEEASLESFYIVGDLLGEGGFGEVYACTHIESGEERAVKVIEKHEDPIENAAVIEEFDIVKDLDHPNILKLYALFESETHFYLVTDLYAGGELYDELLRVEIFQEDEVAMIMNSALSCINYCHKKNLAHLDLKPENILLEDNRNFNDIKIIDFGLALYGDEFEDSRGSAQYMAPQVLHGSYGKKADVWSLGVICFLLLGGYAPFDQGDEELTMDAINEGKFDFADPVWDSVSDDALEFIVYLLAYDESERPTAEEALQHRWLANIRAKQLSAYNKCPDRRASTRASLEGLQSFKTDSKLKQCVCSLIASQLLKKDEKEKIDSLFRAFDLDCDGKISREDFQESYAHFFDLELCDDEIDDVFEHVNISNSGAIEYSEFAVATLAQEGLIDESKLDAAFKIFDKEDKGYISADDLKEILDLDDDMGDYIMLKVIGQVDSSGRGIINYKDFKAMMKSQTSAIDLVPKKKKSSKKKSSRKKNSKESKRCSARGRGGVVNNSITEQSVSSTEATYIIEEEDDYEDY